MAGSTAEAAAEEAGRPLSPRRPAPRAARRGAADDRWPRRRQALTLRAVGERLGVSRTALYRHFADKQALRRRGGPRGLPHASDWRWSTPGTVTARGQAGFEAMGEAYVRFARRPSGPLPRDVRPLRRVAARCDPGHRRGRQRRLRGARRRARGAAARRRGARRRSRPAGAVRLVGHPRRGDAGYRWTAARRRFRTRAEPLRDRSASRRARSGRSRDPLPPAAA